MESLSLFLHSIYQQTKTQTQKQITFKEYDGCCQTIREYEHRKSKHPNLQHHKDMNAIMRNLLISDMFKGKKAFFKEGSVKEQLYLIKMFDHFDQVIDDYDEDDNAVDDNDDNFELLQ